MVKKLKKCGAQTKLNSDKITNISGKFTYFYDEIDGKLAKEIEQLWIFKKLSQPEHDRLTPREYECFLKMCCGKNFAEIAAEMCITEKQVKSIACKCYAKTGCENRLTLLSTLVREMAYLRMLPVIQNHPVITVTTT